LQWTSAEYRRQTWHVGVATRRPHPALLLLLHSETINTFLLVDAAVSFGGLCPVLPPGASNSCQCMMKGRHVFVSKLTPSFPSRLLLLGTGPLSVTLIPCASGASSYFQLCYKPVIDQLKYTSVVQLHTHSKRERENVKSALLRF